MGERPLTPLRLAKVKLWQDSRKPSAAKVVPLRAREMTTPMEEAFILMNDLVESIFEIDVVLCRRSVLDW